MKFSGKFFRIKESYKKEAKDGNVKINNNMNDYALSE
jgi:hypothetical protein